jgi:hypothetical protein
MYEMGFDANDKFFFRKRHQTTALKTITDGEIISMDGVQYDVSRLKTRIVVGYGGYTKIVDSDTQQEPPPTNKDKYGERIYEISGSQLLPADNVDLAYAVAPTIYSELSKLRLTLSIKTVLDLELELGDYVRIVHKNNLFVGNGLLILQMMENHQPMQSHQHMEQEEMERQMVSRKAKKLRLLFI